MRSRITVLVLLTLPVACTNADMPTRPAEAEIPLFSSGVQTCANGTGVGKVPLECGRTHEVFYNYGDPIGLNPTALAAANQAILNWRKVFSDSIHNLPEIEWAYSRDSAAMQGEKAIQIRLDVSGSGAYWCGWTPGTVITIKETDALATGCVNGQATNNLVGLVMHEFTHVVAPAKDVTASDPTYETCQFTHYTYASPTHGHPDELCEWDRQYVFYLYGLRTSQPDFFNPMIIGASLSANVDSVTVGDSVQFTIAAVEDLGSWTSGSAGSFPKTWTVEPPGAGTFNPTPGEYSDAATVTALGLGALAVEVGLKPDANVSWPEPSVTRSVFVSTAVTSVTVSPASLTLTDDDWTTLYQDLTAVTSPTTGGDYDWSSSDESVARVIGWGSTATVEGYASGIARVSVVGDGAVSDTATITVRCGTKSNPACVQFRPVP